MDMDGSNLKQLTQGKMDMSPAISPDGRWVVFNSVQGGKNVLMKVPSEGGPASQLTDYNSESAIRLPGRQVDRLLLLPSQDQPARLAMVPFAGGQPAKVFPLPA